MPLENIESYLKDSIDFTNGLLDDELLIAYLQSEIEHTADLRQIMK